MDTKQLITGSPKEGFYPIVQDTVTVIELNKAVLNLTSESSSEDIIAAFDSVEDFTTLLQNVRNTENIVNGVLVNDSSLVGKIFCNIIAHHTQETLYIDGVFTNQYFNITITNNNGTFNCVKNIVYLNREVGDKTNVLILSLENDLANGQKDSPVTAEVSTALKDAISTGKACVIKSANSDILANLQQISDNVTIVMEQISRVGQTFVAVNTTITVNTATNIISDYQTGAIVLETEGNGNKFLSNDGSYKEINSSVVIPVDLKLNETLGDGGSGDGYDFSQIYNAYISGKTVYLKDSSDDLYLVINALNNGVIYYAINTTGTYSGKPTLYQFKNVNYGGAAGIIYEISIINDPDNILFKDNDRLYTPTADYNPATKKYVDDHNSGYAGGLLNIGENNVSYDEDIINYGYLNVFLSGFGNIIIPIIISADKINTYRTLIPVVDSVGVGSDGTNLVRVTMSDLTKNANMYEGTINVEYLYRMIRESDYNDLGTTPETDDVLYFVIPD